MQEGANMRKRLIGAAARPLLATGLAAVALGLAACGGSGGSGGGSSTGTGSGGGSGGGSAGGAEIAFFTSLGNTYLEATFDGLRAGLRGSGAKVTAFDSQFDPQKQFTQIQDAIATRRFDAFVVFPVDGNAIVPLMRQAADAGIPVVDTDFPIGSRFDTSDPQVPGVVGSVLLPATAFGAALGELTVRACADTTPCEVALLSSFLRSPFDNAVMESVESFLADHPDVEVVTKQEGRLLASTALPVVQNILQAHPDVDVVTANGDQMAAGAEKAIGAAGRAGRVRIIGASAGAIGVRAVRDGRWFGTSVSLPFTEGEVAAEMVVQAIERGRVDPAGVDPVERAGLPPYLSQDNLDQFPADFDGQWKG